MSDDVLDNWPKQTARRPAKRADAALLTTLGETLISEPEKPVLEPIILSPGAHFNVPMETYLRQLALSASVLCEMDQRCPYAAWHSSWLNRKRVPDFSDASDTGEIAHALLLEGNVDRVAVIDPNDYPAKTTGSIPDGWTNVGIRAARDAARDAGKIPMLPCDVAIVNAMVDSAHKYIDSLKLTEPAIWRAFQPGGGDSEVSGIWTDDGTLCRLRADRINKERDLIIDVKTTKRSAEPDGWARAMFSSMGLRLRAAWYTRGAQRVFDLAQSATYVCLLIEQGGPHLCSLVGFDPTSMAIGRQRMEGAFASWRKCMADDYWPGYPSRVCYPEPKPWEIAEMEAGEGNGLPIGYSFAKEGFPL